MIGRKRRSVEEDLRYELATQRPRDLPPTVRVKEPLTVEGRTLQPGQVFYLHDDLVQAAVAELADPHRFFEVVS